MKISDKGLTLIKQFEGCYLKAYQDRVGVWTIGYGTTNSDKSITGKTIKRGMKISQATAESWLKKSLDTKYAPKVNKYNSKYFWSQNEFDALLSFCYNIGSIDQLTAQGTRSRAEIMAAWPLYCKAGKRKVKGLQERREAELKLFRKLTPVISGNPYPELTGTVTSTAKATEKGLQKWIPQGDQVKAVQWELCRLGYQIGQVDGICGPKTVEAIESFQRGSGLTVDGLCGVKTWAALKAAEEKPTVNYRAKAASKAKSIYPLCVGKKHGKGVQKRVKNLKQFKAQNELNCHLMVTLVYQEANLLPKGCFLGHTAKRNGKKCVADAVIGYQKLKHCKVVWVDCLYKDLPKEYKEAGCAYFQDSNACISAGDGYIWTCNKSVGKWYKVKGDYCKDHGYVKTHKILAVAVPDKD